MTSNSLLSSGATTARDWYIDDEVIYGIYDKSEYTEINKDLNLKSGSEFFYKVDYYLKILDIDEDQKDVYVNVSTAFFNFGEIRYPINGSAYSETFLSTDYLLDTRYMYDSVTDAVYLTHFRCELIYLRWFLDIDWSIFNTYFKSAFDDANVVQTVTTPLGPEEITVSDFLSSISYTICGRSNIVNARKQFTETRTRWVLKFNLANTIYFHDTDEDVFVPFDKYKVTFILDYTDGGTLKKYQTIKEYKVETSHYKINFHSERIYTLGGVKKIPLPIGFFAFGFSVVALVILRGRKKNER